MELTTLLQNAPKTELTIVNEPFLCEGTLTITLEGGNVRYWVFSEESELLALAPEDDEALFFRETGEDLEASGDHVLFRGKDFEFTYEDAGKITLAVGDVSGMVDDHLRFSDYEADDGSLVRIVTNENTGETSSYIGEVVTMEEIMPVS